MAKVFAIVNEIASKDQANQNQQHDMQIKKGEVKWNTNTEFRYNIVIEIDSPIIDSSFTNTLATYFRNKIPTALAFSDILMLL